MKQMDGNMSQWDYGYFKMFTSYMNENLLISEFTLKSLLKNPSK